MRARVSFLVAIVTVTLGVASCVQPLPPQAPRISATSHDNARRIAAMLDYVAADYPGATAPGAPPAELAEQVNFLRDASQLAQNLLLGDPPPLPKNLSDLPVRIRALADAASKKAPSQEIVTTCRTLRRSLLDGMGIVLAPLGPPSLEQGAHRFAQACATCHGEAGMGDGAQAKTLQPPPRNLQDAEVLSSMSPARVFQALTDGVSGTAMPSFGVLSPSERWSLAFYVMGLRHRTGQGRGQGTSGKTDGESPGAALYHRLRPAIAATPTRLAELSDGDILQTLAAEKISEAEQKQLLGFLRTEAPYQAKGKLLVARSRMAESMTAYKKGDTLAAGQLLTSSYLDGFEPHEGKLRAEHPSLVERVEERYVALRAAMEKDQPMIHVEQEMLRLGAVLDRVDEALTGKSGRVAFMGALLILLRESLEVSLLLLVLLGLARQTQNDDELGPSRRRAVHAGWMAALGIGSITWVLTRNLLASAGSQREIFEGTFSILAALLLLAGGHYVIARADSRRRLQAMKIKVAEESKAGGRPALLFTMAFFAIYREVLETILFLQTLLLDAEGASTEVAAGALVGLLLSLGFVIVGLRLGKRLRPGPLLTVSGTLMCALAAMVTGKGIHSLQEGGLVPIHPIPFFKVAWLGIYPNWEGLASQLTIIALFFVALFWSRAQPFKPRAAQVTTPDGKQPDKAAAGAKRQSLVAGDPTAAG